MTYCDFKVGDEVVCVDASFNRLLRDGATYAVDQVGIISGCVRYLDRNGLPGIRLKGVDSTVLDGNGLFLADRFRKVERKTDKLNLTEWLAQPTDYDEEQRNPAPAAPAKRERV